MIQNLTKQTLLRHALALLVISIAVFLLSFFQATVTLWQQVIVLLIAVVLFTFNKISNVQSQKFTTTPMQWAFIYLCLMIVQLIIYSSGGLYSPFFILLHISTLALSFLVSLPIAMLFLIFSVVNLLIDTILDTAVHGFIQSSLTGAILYVASVAAIVPLAWYVAQQYQLKQALSKTLARQVSLGQTILSNVQEYVYITDTQLKILSANPPVERELHMYLADILNKPLLEVLILKDGQGKFLTSEMLNLNQIAQDKQGRTIQHLRLFGKNLLPLAVQLHIQPIKDENGEVGQFIIIITDQGKNISQATETILSQAQLKRQAQIQAVLAKLAKLGLTDVTRQLMFAENIAYDLVLVEELQREGISLKDSLTDIAQLAERTVTSMQPLMEALGVQLTFDLPNFEPKTKLKLLLNGEIIGPKTVTGPEFTVPIDSRWLGIIVQKLIVLASLRSTANHGIVAVTITIEPESFNLSVAAHLPQNVALNSLVESPASLQYSSGLEDYIVRAVAPHLPLEVQSTANEEQYIYTWQVKIYKPATSVRPRPGSS